MLSPACCTHCREHAVHIVFSTLSPACCPHCDQHPAHTVTKHPAHNILCAAIIRALLTGTGVLPGLRPSRCCAGCTTRPRGAPLSVAGPSVQLIAPRAGARASGARRRLFLSCRDQLHDSHNQLVTDPSHILPYRGQWDPATPPPSSRPPRSSPSASPSPAASPARPKPPAGRRAPAPPAGHRAAQPAAVRPGQGRGFFPFPSPGSSTGGGLACTAEFHLINLLHVSASREQNLGYLPSKEQSPLFHRPWSPIETCKEEKQKPKYSCQYLP